MTTKISVLLIYSPPFFSTISNPWKPQISSLDLLIFSFGKCYVNYIVHDLLVLTFFHSATIPLRSTQAVSCISSSFIFTATQNFKVCLKHSFLFVFVFNHSTIVGCFGCFQFFAFANKAALNKHGRGLYEHKLLFSWNKCLGG